LGGAAGRYTGAMKRSNPSSGARRTNAAQRAQFLAEFDRSGLSAAAFARRHKLNYTTFCGWRQQRAAGKFPAFVQVELPSSSAAAELAIELGPQITMRIGSAAQIGLAAQLLKTLHSPASC